jgi:hypothetical protein
VKTESSYLLRSTVSVRRSHTFRSLTTILNVTFRKKRPSLLLLHSCSNLGTHIAKVFRAGPGSQGLLLFQNSKKLLRSRAMAIGNKLHEGVSAFLLWALNNTIRRNVYFLMYLQDLRNTVKGMSPPVRLLTLNCSLMQRSTRSTQTASSRAARTTKRWTVMGTVEKTGASYDSFYTPPSRSQTTRRTH